MLQNQKVNNFASFLLKINMCQTFIQLTNWTRFVHFNGSVDDLKHITPNDL